MSPALRFVPILAVTLLSAAAPAAAQGFGMSQGGGDQQLQVFADNGIEWHSEDLRVIATGNAKATRGTMSVDADKLTAYYRQTGGKGDEIWRLDADGTVTIRSPNDTATGTKAIYDLDKAVFVLKGAPARLVTATDQFQASESLEYWEAKKMAVLRGDAVATRDNRTLRADVITAHFQDKATRTAQKSASGTAKGSSDSLDLQRADAYGHVRLTTATETVTGDRGDYDATTEIATVTGSVKITREGGNQLEGGWAYVNLKTGISKLFPAPPGTNGASPRVQGVFTPKKQDEQGRSGFSGRVPSNEDFSNH
ncbi:LptA/OstA family protein [Magnetospirillum molischianum]|uniref:Organic solvent tolerance-like N-terminal domain-containing protein n=1 Tax=Magnetospirillum molischianum DSM 120 TaxID=1150626 RepID=H8FVY5_MAGML|nr:LptA/OstA family protein [Magnetospirillum molischianum]CCG42523.1 conserved exported hypothetical protein [Magnetospirillum molischianum DSM 120]